MARVEGILDEMCSRFNHVESGLDGLEARITVLRRDMETSHIQLRRDMETQFRWLVGILLGLLIPMWVSIILAIVFTS